MLEGLLELLSSWTVPLSIFFAEMTVVTAGTLRIIFISRGHKYLAPILGFFEILVWLFAISQVMQNLGSTPCFLAFAFGFTLGNFLGIWIEGRLALGMVGVRVITQQDCRLLVEKLRAANFGVTCVEGMGSKGPVLIIFTVIKRKQLPRVIAMIRDFQPNAFYSVDDLQTYGQGIFPTQQGRSPSFLPSVLTNWRTKGDGATVMEKAEPAIASEVC